MAEDDRRPPRRPPPSGASRRPPSPPPRASKSARLRRGGGAAGSKSERLSRSLGRSKSERLSRTKSQRLTRATSERFARSKSGRLGPRSQGLVAPPEPDSLLGRRVAKRYQLLGVQRQGRLSISYDAEVVSPHEGEESQVIVRVAHPVLLEPPTDHQVLSWLASHRALDPPGIVPAREYGREADVLYAVYDACRGRPLSELLRAEGPLAPPRAISIVRQAAEALAAAHSLGVIHQQLSPECLWVDEEDRVQLSDFGLTSPSRPVGTNVVALNLSAAKYASPELAWGESQVEQSDVYCLGLILYECLSGQLPFTGFFVDQLLRARLDDPAPPVRQRVPSAGVHPALDELLQRALAREVAPRVPSMSELLAQLAAAEAASQEEQLSELPDLELVEGVPLPGLEPELGVCLARREGRVVLAWSRGELEVRRVEEGERALQAAAAVAHPALAPLAGWERRDGGLAVYSAWSGGSTARERIQAGPTPPAEVFAATLPPLEGLAASHGAGVSHGALDPRLLQLGERPLLHGLGVLPALRGAPAWPAVDVRDFALLQLQLLAGALLEEVGREGLHDRGLRRVSPAVAEVLTQATGPEPPGDAGEYLIALSTALEPPPAPARLSVQPPLPALAAGALLLALLFALGVVFSDPPAEPSSPSPGAAAAQGTPSRAGPSLPSPKPSPSVPPSPRPSPSARPPSPSPSPSRPLEPDWLAEAPSWFRSLPEAVRPPLPLPAGLRFGEGGAYVLERSGSLLVWASDAGVFMGKHEVTWAEFRAFCADSSREPPSPRFEVEPDHPVHAVAWEEARAFAVWAGARLPSAREWELAAGTAEYPWGSDPPHPTLANLRGSEDGFARTSPAGRFPAGASRAGCLDMAGNVAEWVADTWEGEQRVVRGGGWFSGPWSSRISWSGHAAPGRRFDHVGFRLALSPSGP